MMIATGDGKCRQDRIVLRPITSEILGGAHMDNAIGAIVERLLEKPGLPTGDAKKALWSMFREQEYQKCKTKLIAFDMVVEGLTLRDDESHVSEAGDIRLAGTTLHIES